MKVACYMRVSTDDQTTALQRDAIESYCKLRSWINPAPIFFEDAGVSGAKTSRPALDELMRRVRAGEFHVVVTWKLDRLGRSSIHLISIIEELRTLDVQFVSVTEMIDTTTPMGKMVFTIFAALAEFERATIIERTRAGIKAAQARGKHCGRPEEISEKTARDVLYLRGQGHSLDEIHSCHADLSRSTIGRIIKGIPRGNL
jgi:DNA invertase Pin-like site-specific DNA recombinase